MSTVEECSRRRGLICVLDPVVLRKYMRFSDLRRLFVRSRCDINSSPKIIIDSNNLEFRIRTASRSSSNDCSKSSRSSARLSISNSSVCYRPPRPGTHLVLQPFHNPKLLFEGGFGPQARCLCNAAEIQRCRCPLRLCRAANHSRSRWRYPTKPTSPPCNLRLRGSFLRRAPMRRFGQSHRRHQTVSFRGTRVESLLERRHSLRELQEVAAYVHSLFREGDEVRWYSVFVLAGLCIIILGCSSVFLLHLAIMLCVEIRPYGKLIRNTQPPKGRR